MGDGLNPGRGSHAKAGEVGSEIFLLPAATEVVDADGEGEAGQRRGEQAARDAVAYVDQDGRSEFDSAGDGFDGVIGLTEIRGLGRWAQPLADDIDPEIYTSNSRDGAERGGEPEQDTADHWIVTRSAVCIFFNCPQAA